mmetsp:Transcript_13006/g.37097  ORF Transcript_13006/g.37097 Transcript_13006/m.37097 type:complete len:200 (-) Transcript_13006:695-1294(-)
MWKANAAGISSNTFAGIFESSSTATATTIGVDSSMRLVTATGLLVPAGFLLSVSAVPLPPPIELSSKGLRSLMSSTVYTLAFCSGMTIHRGFGPVTRNKNRPLPPRAPAAFTLPMTRSAMSRSARLGMLRTSSWMISSKAGGGRVASVMGISPSRGAMTTEAWFGSGADPFMGMTCAASTAPSRVDLLTVAESILQMTL